MVTFYRGKPIDPRHLSGYILSGLCFVCFLTFALTFYWIFIDDTLRLSGRFPLYVKEPAKNCSKYVLLRYRSFTILEQSSMFILWYSASSTFGKDSDIVMGVRAQQKEKNPPFAGGSRI